MANFFNFFTSAALFDNLVVMQILGASAFLAASSRLRESFEFAQFAFLLLLLLPALNLLLFHGLLAPLSLQLLQLPIFAITGAAGSTLLCKWSNRHAAFVARRHGLALLMFGGSSAVVGSSLLLAELPPANASTWGVLAGNAFGFAVLLPVFAALREKLDALELPQAFRGPPAYLICLGLISLCLMSLGDN